MIRVRKLTGSAMAGAGDGERGRAGAKRRLWVRWYGRWVMMGADDDDDG